MEEATYQEKTYLQADSESWYVCKFWSNSRWEEI